jgi:hypothetical protein
MSKRIEIDIPLDSELPSNFGTFSLEENIIALKLGYNFVSEGKKILKDLNNEEEYKKIENSFKREIEIEKLSSIKMNEKMEQFYKSQIEQLNNKIDKYICQIKEYEKNKENSLNEEILKVKEKYELMYREKEKQVDKMIDNHNKYIIEFQSTKSASHKGSEGEQKFENYAETFKDFKGFEIIDKHKQSGQGDFHLHFEEFDILVDAKNYKNKVPNEQIEKIKKDLLKNEHLQFAWLVSLNTSIDKWDKAGIMCDYINTKQCLVYINNLCGSGDPRKTLRTAWFQCKILNGFTKDVTFEQQELMQIKDERYKMMDKIRNLRKNIRELNTSINTTKNLVQVMDDELRGMLENNANELVKSNIYLFDEWWETNIEIVSEDKICSSSDLWIRFKQYNKSIINEMNVTGDKFKQYLKTKVPITSIILRNKNASSAFDIKGIKLKEKELEKLKEIVTENKIEVELNEEVINKKKIIKKK